MQFVNYFDNLHNIEFQVISKTRATRKMLAMAEEHFALLTATTFPPPALCAIPADGGNADQEIVDGL